MTRFNKILVPHDFSSHADHALDTAVELARRYDASVSVVHVHDVVLYALPEGMVAYPAEMFADLFTRLRQDLDKVVQRVRDQGFTRIDGELLQGSPVNSIVQHALAQGCDLIVMGTHGRTGFAHALIGSVAERVVRTAPCPVLTLRAPKA